MSEAKKESRFLQKWKLVRAAARDNKRLSTGDIAVLIALCDRYGSKYDPDAPALAGHALLGAMSGLSRRATIDSTRRLIDAGYINVLELGSGTRGTRYGLDFSRGEDNFTAMGENSSGEAEFTTVVNRSSPLGTLSGEAYFTESPPTVFPLQGDIHVVGSNFDDAPLAPLSVGLAATDAVPPSGGFEEFWNAWPRKHGMKKAKTTWKRLAPDTELAMRIIATARDWAAHYASHAVDKKWIPEPANWLDGERWDEDLPIIHIDSKGAAIAKAKANAAPADKAKGSKKHLTEKLRILSVEEIGNCFSDWHLRLKLDDEAGNTHDHILHVLSPDGPASDNDTYQKLSRIADLNRWPGMRVHFEIDGDVVVDVLEAKAGERVVYISSAPIIEERGESRMLAELLAADGDRPEGFLEITTDSDLEFIREKGKQRVLELMRAVGLTKLEDTDDLLLRPFVITEDGGFLPMPDDGREAA